MDKRLILLAGNYQVGKSYLAKSLERQLPNSINLSLATEIREKLSESLSIPKDILYQKPTPNYIRQLICGYGTYIKEFVNKDYWCETLYRNFIFSKKDILIIDDFRFIHEFNYFQRFFEKLDIIYIGGKSNDYELEEIFSLSNIKVNKYPDINEILELI
jgi:tRNA uridine 5-carbamoylmethylation protein Kti12